MLNAPSYIYTSRASIYYMYYLHLIEIYFLWIIFNADAGACTNTNIFYIIKHELSMY